MVDTLLLIGIALFFLYAFYDQFGMDKLKGKTKLKVRLKKRAKIDALIFIGLIIIILYQTYANISPITLYLLATAIILSLYMAFIRSPELILKETGFFYENIFIQYEKIDALNLADNHILVIDLKNGKRLIAPLQNPQDQESVVAFFGGYKK
ncbi:DUF986 family protein [Caviibacterium pharyngocola]|uniref:UPF0266 membrane protein CVP04_06605 n=1 Tax=Caviibacterium pharyngocola TaxID=28159 RepID=A0A2M8RVX0_9PAST|nr:DUF986 family protein [Caviibacterium pharyngocola]PJG83023.1 hypothetical protein CVP04_06605 [Caviibacterium pharyngocola]